MVRLAVAVAAFVAAGAAECAWGEPCYDLARGEPATLTGQLDYAIFPGPPNYKDVQGGDAPEPNFVLRLPAPICLTGDDFADPNKPFSAVQVLANEDEARRLRELLHKPVTLTLRGPMAAQTGHHHEPLVAWVASAQLASARPVEQAVEYGSAAATVRAFYEALSRGEGEVASLLLVPAARRAPAFSASAMSRFYGSLREPIHLVHIEQNGPNSFRVQYRFATGSSVCNGRAVVTTAAEAGANYIASIDALGGC